MAEVTRAQKSEYCQYPNPLLIPDCGSAETTRKQTPRTLSSLRVQGKRRLCLQGVAVTLRLRSQVSNQPLLLAARGCALPKGASDGYRERTAG